MHKIYAGQVIIAFSSGDDANLISKSIDALKHKAKLVGLETFDGVLKDHPAAKKEADLLKGFFTIYGQKLKGVRIYLLGHAAWLAHRLGSWSSEQVADLLGGAKFNGKGVISIIGCEAAKNIDDKYPPEVTDWEDSFASKLQYHLKKKHGIEAPIFARIQSVGVFSDIHKEKFSDEETFADMKGRKFVLSKDEMRINKAESTKLRFYWDGNKQMRQWVY